MTGNGLLRLQVFDVNAILRPGQELVTFGSAGGRPYVPGVPVGVITRLEGTSSSLTKEALVRPFADDTALGVVGVVVVPPRTDPQVLGAAAEADPVPDCFGHPFAGPSRGVSRRHSFSRDRGHAHHRTGGLTCGVRRWRPRCCCSPP